MLTCTKCKVSKCEQAFSVELRNSSGRHSWCRECKVIQNRLYRERSPEKTRQARQLANKKHREKNREALNKKARLWHHRNKEYSNNRTKEWYQQNQQYANQKSREWRYKNRYGLDVETVLRMREEQQYSCAICKRHESELNRILCIDHNHKTGKVRKLLCTKCNAALGNLDEQISLFVKAIQYLQDHQ